MNKKLSICRDNERQVEFLELQNVVIKLTLIVFVGHLSVQPNSVMSAPIFHA